MSLVDSSALTFAAPRVAAHSSHVRCNAGKKLRRLIAGLGAMYTYTPAALYAECARVWGDVSVFPQVSRHAPMQTLTQDRHGRIQNEKRINKKNGSQHIYSSGKCPGEMSRQNDRRIQIMYSNQSPIVNSNRLSSLQDANVLVPVLPIPHCSSCHA